MEFNMSWCAGWLAKEIRLMDKENRYSIKSSVTFIERHIGSK